MDGHHHNTRHHDRREEEYNHPPPPPQVHHTGPAPPQVHHTSHTVPTPNAPPVYTINAHNPSPPQVHHTSYSPPPSHVPSHSPPPAAHNELANKPSVRMYCKAEPNFSLTIREGKVVLAPSNSADPLQHWIKDEKFSTRVKDKEGFPSFALVNKATGQAMKHSIGVTQPVERRRAVGGVEQFKIEAWLVELSPYNSNKLDESILWTESKDLGDGYHAVRMVSNIKLNVDAFNGDKNHGGVHDGTRIVLWEWKKDSNQRWKIVPF
ncbi:ricin B-like lectin R40G3 isoform X1 [Salvia splendens]|uniref:ricin B-like lectin R40G3 isoform X1 n=1 Tax=Salvia splendens TaxID=180675 RepID=UPI001C26527A|nr:ricin B-like lectin R40G3 isoform X1 [Salvia splendens]